MVRIGKASRFRVPAFSGSNTMTYLDSDTLKGKTVVLSFVPRLTPVDIALLSAHAERFATGAVSFLIAMAEDQPFHQAWLRQVGPLQLHLLADPIGRLRRSYGLDRRAGLTRCHSFVVGPDGLLQFQLVHDLDLRGMKPLLELLEAVRRER